MDDPTTVIQGVGPVMKEKLAGIGINTVKQFLETENCILTNEGRLKEKKLKTIEDWIQTVLILDLVPKPDDHRKHENPYLSRFGKDSWEEEIKKSTGVKKFCCMTPFP